MGLFDTVAQEGLPGKVNLGYNLSIPSGIARVYHLTANDERRNLFPSTSIGIGPGVPNPNPNFEEVGIPGVHSDVGGGYRNGRAKANSALLLMWRDGIDHKVPFRQIPPEYSVFDDTTEHDSRYITDKAKDGLRKMLHMKKRLRKIYYQP